jgi:hypothetical protein
MYFLLNSDLPTILASEETAIIIIINIRIVNNKDVSLQQVLLTKGVMSSSSPYKYIEISFYADIRIVSKKDGIVSPTSVAYRGALSSSS